MYVLVVLFLILMYCLALVSKVTRANIGARLELSPMFLFSTAFLLYCCAMPISRVAFRTPETELDTMFMALHSLAAVGLLIGALIARSVGFFTRPVRFFTNVSGRKTKGRLLVVFMLAANAGLFWEWFSGVQYDIGALFSRYGFGDKSYSDITILSTTLSVVSTAAAWSAFYHVVYLRTSSRVMRFLVMGAIAGQSLFYLCRGNRNSIMILCLPLVVMKLRGIRVPIRKVVGWGLIAWFAIYSVGVIRNWGITRVAEVTFSHDMYDPLNGEFGTLHSVYSKVVSKNLLEGDQMLGSSYFISPLLNLIPRQIWPDRPLTAAQSASVTHYGKSVLEAGIGYSPVVEAMANFGSYGILPVFLVAGLFFSWLECLFDGPGTHCGIFYAVLPPMLINFLRIDFATAFKMWAVHAAAAGLILWLFRDKSKNKRPVPIHTSNARTYARRCA